MSFDLESLIVDDADRVVTSVTHKDIVTALSATLGAQTVTVLHILYPRTDARTHTSQEALVAALHRHGMHQVARLIAEETHYLLFRDPVKARAVLHEIRNDSLAIGVHVYYKGLAGSAAEEKLDADAQKARRA
jgi:hypothetical protein